MLSLMPQRKDLFVIINKAFTSLLPAFTPHCIPFYISYRVKSSARFRFLQRLIPNPVHSEFASSKLNLESLKLAANKINNGGVVIIAPGAGNKENKFKIGIGYLLNEFLEPEKINIIMTHISGTSKSDYIRLIPFLKNLLPRYKIRFSTPVSAKKFVKGNIRNDTLELQNHYFNWVRSQGLQL